MEPGLVEEIAQAMRRPEGTLAFEYSSDAAFNKASAAGTLIEIPAGAHVFRLDRTDDRVLRFFHASPGTGTRVAEVPLDGLPDFNQAFLVFTWSPSEVRFHCGPRFPGAQLLSATGRQADTQLVVGRDGRVFQLGDTGIEVVAVRVRENGRLVLTPPAIEAWKDTLKAIEVLWTGESDQGFMFEVLQANVTLSILVTGLETYAKTRLLELEAEGIEPESAAVFEAFASRAERDSGRLRELEDEAKAAGKSILAGLVDNGRINFQSYENLKRAYKAAYGVNLAELEVDSQALEQLQRFIKYRHRVVHVSPLLGMLNEETVPPDEPVFASHATADRAIACFAEFVEALHAGTLKLRPVD